MKKILILCMVFCLVFSACTVKNTVNAPETAGEVSDFLLSQNQEYVSTEKNDGDISLSIRKATATNGQKPYAVVITCSDSRVVPEHIFSAGIGELFVIRTAGNVIGDYELGSVEYGAEHLGAKLVLVLGHTSCGAVDATLSGGGHGNIKLITDEISKCLPQNCNPREAEILNVKNSVNKIKSSEMMKELIKDHGVAVKGAIYDIETGKVYFVE